MVWLIKYLTRLWKRRQAARGASSPKQGGDADGDPDADSEPERDGTVRQAMRAPGPGASAGTRGLLGLLVHQTAYDLRISLRSPRARFMTFIFPIVLLVVFNGVFGKGHTTIDGTRVELKEFYVPGILTMAIVVTAYAGLVISISTLRETGVLKRRRATPVPPAVLIASQALTTLANTAAISALLLVIAQVVYGVGISAPAIAAIACTALVGTLAFACIGYAVSGLIGSPDAAQPIVQATMLPLWFISGVFVPLGNLSTGLRDLGSVFPVAHLAGSLRLAAVHGSFGAALSTTDLLVLAAWGIGAGAFAAWRFNWLPTVASA